ncbi:MAG TPA: dienelactone hydrolase family protein [Candidatus Desulfobacillus denitrificans]|nr:dienelactone hydrolase family protein [Candidatus Desulfobacillus denitrificans]HNT63585.1 dienelactone hydrolase family protein [Candidatus Desulfobacillus denitrificans]
MEVLIPAGKVSLPGTATLPDDALGIVAFAHGSGSSRHSPRNRYVAEVLHAHGIATLLFDLLTPQEDRAYETRFDIDLLTERLLAALAWLEASAETKNLKIGCFGASTGAAAALRAAAQHASVAAVVSRGGRPDLAGAPALAAVRAPTLLIVGGRDEGVIELNQQACALLQCEKKLEIVPGATHLFEEPGALERAAAHAAAWFARHLGNARA